MIMQGAVLIHVDTNDILNGAFNHINFSLQKSVENKIWTMYSFHLCYWKNTKNSRKLYVELTMPN